MNSNNIITAETNDFLQEIQFDSEDEDFSHLQNLILKSEFDSNPISEITASLETDDFMNDLSVTIEEIETVQDKLLTFIF
jgi:hypothetical protein